MRFNLVGLIIGGRGTGKSLFLLGSKYSSKPGDDKLNIKGLLELYEKKNIKILILDTLDHPSYRKIPILEQKNFKKFNSGVARIFTDPDNIVKIVDLINKTPSYNNTFIVFEDAVKYIGSKLSGPIKRLIVDSKQRNIDVIFMFHCWIDTPGDIFTKSDFIQIFKTEDSPEVREKKIRLYKKVFSAYEEVNKNNDRFFGILIDTRTA